MGYSKQRLKEVAALKKAAVRRIRTDIGELDTSPTHKYIEDFTNQFGEFREICTLAEIFREAALADLIWIGDYHALPQYQSFAVEFVRGLFHECPHLALGVEPIFARHQKVLDRWLEGHISETEFLETVHYDEEWGCDWGSYRRLFTTARDLGIPVYGIDCHPRFDMRSIGRRDRGTASRIAAIMQHDPGRKLVVMFGESHLAWNHLPVRVHDALSSHGTSCRELLILQNLDEIYWQLQDQGRTEVAAVRLDERQYCVFNATPIEKYESFRQYLHKCVDEDDSGAWTQFIHTLIETVLEFVAVKPGGGLNGDFPKVYAEISPARLPRFLARQAVSNDEVETVLDSIHDRGTSYVPQLNSIFIQRFQVASAAEESVRFIHTVCRGELRKSADRTAHDQFFVGVMECALGYFGSKLLDSSRDGIEALSKRVLDQIGYNGRLSRAVSSLLDPARRPAAQHFNTLRSAIGAGGRSGKTMQLLGQLLGYALGRRLYEAYLGARISRKEIQALFYDPLDEPNRPLERYRELTERLS